MEVHREDQFKPKTNNDNQLNGEAMPSARNGKSSKKGKYATVRQVDLEVERESLKNRLRTEKNLRLLSDLQNPLGEQAVGPRILQQGFTATVQKMFEQDARSKIYSELLNIKSFQELRLPAASVLALLFPEREKFLNALADVRREGSSPENSTAQTEAMIWGVNQATQSQLLGYLQELSIVSSGYRSKSDPAQANLAIIKVNGLLRLNSFLATLEQKLYAVSPQGVWEQRVITPLSAEKAAQIYVDRVRHLIKPEHKSIANKLFSVLWNVEGIVKGIGRYGGAETSENLIEKVLTAAILNRLGPNKLRELDQHVVGCVQFKKKGFVISRNAVMKALGLEQSDPHFIFIDELLQAARKGQSAHGMLHSAWSKVADSFHRTALKSLVSIEQNLSKCRKPGLARNLDQAEYYGATYLDEMLNDFKKAFSDHPLCQLASVQDSARLVQGVNSIMGLSSMLAGIPRHMVQKLLL